MFFYETLPDTKNYEIKFVSINSNKTYKDSNKKFKYPDIESLKNIKKTKQRKKTKRTKKN